MANYANQLTIKIDVDKAIRKVGENGEAFAPWVWWKYKKAAVKKLELVIKGCVLHEKNLKI